MTVHDGTPVKVEPGPDEPAAPGKPVLMIDRVRQSVLAEELPPSADAAEQAAQVARRLTRILRLPGECTLESSARTPSMRVDPRVEVDVPEEPRSGPSLIGSTERASSLPGAYSSIITTPPPPEPARVSALPPPAIRTAIPPSMRPSTLITTPPPPVPPRITIEPPPPPPSAPSMVITTPPPSVRPRISVDLPGQASTSDSYSGRRVSVPADLPPRSSRTPAPPSLRGQAQPALTPPPPSLRTPPPSKTPTPLSNPVSQTALKRVALPPSVPPPRMSPPPVASDEVALTLLTVKGRVAQLDFVGADRIFRERPASARRDAELDALALWVRANVQSDLEPLIRSLDKLIFANATCEHALYYRGLVLKRAGQRKAALRDFVTVVKQHPKHAGALAEIKELRSSADE